MDSSTWDLRMAVQEFEKWYISAVMASSEGDKGKAALRLGIGLSSLYRKLIELGIATGVPSQASASYEV